MVTPERVLTLALPKTGLSGVGELYLADIGIPAAVHGVAGADYRNPFRGDWVQLVADS